MSKRAFDRIEAGLDDAQAFLEGRADTKRYRVHVPASVDVKRIRKRPGLTQEGFAATYGFALSAVRDWEQGRRQPERSARRRDRDQKGPRSMAGKAGQGGGEEARSLATRST